MSPADDLTPHHAIISAALRRLGSRPAAWDGDVRLLAGGASGSHVFRITLAGEDAVLKVTLPSGGPVVAARAHREARFYRDLASCVPLRVPRLLAFDVDETEGTTILLAACQPVSTPATWSEPTFTSIAEELGRFHAAYWDRASELDGLPWLSPPRSPVTAAQCRRAATRWRSLEESAPSDELFTPRRRQAVAEFLERLPALDQSQILLPPTLCHGDCHAGNVLLGPSGECVWADWQEVRIGPGPDDLAFFGQRALAAGGRVPYAAMSHAYRTSLAAATEHPPAPEAIDAALTWSELRSWLLDWPPYLRFLSTGHLARVFDRIDDLVACVS